MIERDEYRMSNRMTSFSDGGRRGAAIARSPAAADLESSQPNVLVTAFRAVERAMKVDRKKIMPPLGDPSAAIIRGSIAF
jgi:hypothetical protein